MGKKKKFDTATKAKLDKALADIDCARALIDELVENEEVDDEEGDWSTVAEQLDAAYQDFAPLVNPE